MFAINEEDEMVVRTREQIKMKVNQLRSLGKSDDEIVQWIEKDLDKELPLHNYFDGIQEVAELVEIPLHKFHYFWMT